MKEKRLDRYESQAQGLGYSGVAQMLLGVADLTATAEELGYESINDAMRALREFTGVPAERGI